MDWMNIQDSAGRQGGHTSPIRHSTDGDMVVVGAWDSLGVGRVDT